MTDTTPAEALARAEAFAAVHRRLLGSDAHARFGRFTLSRTLGRGAQGRVYAAFDPTLEREVALKLFTADNPGAVARGLAEGRALARLRHPNLVRIHDVVEQDGVLGLAMERIDGPTLREWLRDRPPRAEVIEAITAIARGLAALHAAGLVHRDIKPENILVDRSLGPCIVDLGLACEHGAEPTRSLRSGTPGYLAPEQHHGIDVGPAADQFAWAVVAWEAASGRRPEGERDEASEIPRDLAAILRRALAEDPQRRHPSMHAVVEALQRRHRKRRVRRTVAVALVGAAALVGIQAAFAPRDTCSEPDPALAAIWDPQRADRLRDHLAGLAAPTAPDLAAHIVHELDTDHASIVDTHRWACEETRAGRPRLAEQFCVSEAAAELATTVDTLSQLDAASLADGADLVASMRSPLACRARPHDDPPTSDAAALAELARTRGSLRALASACATMGADACRQRFDEIDATIPPGECALHPVAAFERGRGLHDAGAGVEAIEHVHAAAWSAESCGLRHLELTAKRYSAMLAALHSDFDQATWWLAATESALERLPASDFHRGEVALTRGVIDALRGETKRSVEELREAVALLEPHRDTASELLAVAYLNLGQSAGELGLHDEAVAAIEACLALQRARLGPVHPTIGRTSNSLAIALHRAGDTAAARRSLDESIALFERWGDRYPKELAEALDNLALMEREAGRLDEAIAAFERALELREALGDAHPGTIAVLHNLGGAEAMDGDVPAAAEHLTEALDRGRALWGHDHPRADAIAVSLANVRLMQSRFDDALELGCAPARRTRERLGADHRSTVIAAAVCATAMEARGDHASVIAEFGSMIDAQSEDESTDHAALRLALAKSRSAVGEREKPSHAVD